MRSNFVVVVVGSHFFRSLDLKTKDNKDVSFDQVKWTLAHQVGHLKVLVFFRSR